MNRVVAISALLVFGLWAPGAHAQIELPPPAQPATDDDGSAGKKVTPIISDATEAFLVTATGDSDNRTGEPVFVVITVKNVSGQDLLLRNAEFSLAGEWTNVGGKTIRCTLNQRGEIRLRNDLSLEQVCRFDVVMGGNSGFFKRSRSGLLSSKLKLSVLLDTKELGSFRYYPSISVPAQEYSVFIGGVLGALLLAIFVWIERMLKKPVMRVYWVRSLVPALLMGLRGGIMAIIALLLGKSSQSAGAPITLTVTDFTGGLLIGLFSYPLAAWITSALKLDTILFNKPNVRQSRRRRGVSAPEPLPTPATDIPIKSTSDGVTGP